MTTAVAPAPIWLGETTTTLLRPRFEGCNINTWVGFKHVNYLVEEAVLEYLRQHVRSSRELFETYGLCVELVDVDTQIRHAFHADDLVIADVSAEYVVDGQLALTVVLTVDGDGGAVRAANSRVRVVLRADRRWAAEPAPTELAPIVVDRVTSGPGGHRPVPSGDLAAAPASLGLGRGVTADLATNGSTPDNAFAWRWRIPYFYCHFTERLQMSGYLRLMEEVVDLFLAARGVSIKRLLDEQDWIPVVPHTRVRLLDEAVMEEELYTVLTVEDIFKDLTYRARMDCYVDRGGVLVPTATGTITHGYAVVSDRRDWSLVALDARLRAALRGERTTG